MYWAGDGGTGGGVVCDVKVLEKIYMSTLAVTINWSAAELWPLQVSAALRFRRFSRAGRKDCGAPRAETMSRTCQDHR